jgi:hypothetical protein
MDDCCGVCCICIACVGASPSVTTYACPSAHLRYLHHLHAALVSSAFRYVPFQTMSQCLSCRGKGAAADDDDFDPMKFPAANSAFTADGECIHPYTSSLPMQVRASPHPHPQPEPPMDNADPFAPPPPPHIVSPPPPDYSASVRDGLQSDSEQPLGLGYRPQPMPGPGQEDRALSHYLFPG